VQRRRESERERERERRQKTKPSPSRLAGREREELGTASSHTEVIARLPNIISALAIRQQYSDFGSTEEVMNII